MRRTGKYNVLSVFQVIRDYYRNYTVNSPIPQPKENDNVVFMNHNIKEKHDWFLFFYVEHSFKYEEDTRTHHDQPIK